MKQFGPYQVSVRLPDDPEITEKEIGLEIAELLAAHFEVKIHDPGKRQGPRPRPGITVRRPADLHDSLS